MLFALIKLICCIILINKNYKNNNNKKESLTKPELCRHISKSVFIIKESPSKIDGPVITILKYLKETKLNLL